MQRWAAWAFAVLRRAAWAPLAVFAVHVVASKVFAAYERWPWFDIPMHFAGGAAIAYLWHAASALGSERGVLGRWHQLTHGLLVFGWTGVAAVAWEFAEFASDRLFGTRMQNGDLEDTLADLLLGLAGGLGVAAWACLPGPAPPPTERPPAEPATESADGTTRELTPPGR